MAKALTVKGIEAIRAPVGKDRDYISDTGQGSAKGLVLMVTRTGTKSWLWRSRDASGRQVKRTLGSYPALGLADARERAGEYERARLAGHDLDAQRAVEKTVQDAAKAVAEAEAIKTLRWFWETLYCPKYIPNPVGNETARLIERNLLPDLGARPLAGITLDDLEAAVAKLAKRAPGSADRFVVCLRTLFSRAKRKFRPDLILATDPAADLEKPGHDVKVRDRSLSETEIVYFYRALARAKGVVRVHAECMELLLDVGGRFSEARGLVWEEIDWQEGVWTIPAIRTKTGKKTKRPHVLPLPAEVLERLQERRRRTNQRWAFWSPLSEGQPYNSLSRSQDKLEAIMQALAAEDGIALASWSPHDLRRTFKSRLYKAANQSLHPLVTEANVDRAQDHATGSEMGRRYDQSQYFAEKKAVYRFWQDTLMALRKRAEKAEAGAAEP